MVKHVAKFLQYTPVYFSRIVARSKFGMKLQLDIFHNIAEQSKVLVADLHFKLYNHRRFAVEGNGINDHLHWSLTMRHGKPQSIRSILLMIVILMLATLACNLSRSEDDGGNGDQANSGNPSVTIQSPVSNTSVPRNSAVTLQVKATDPSGSGITRVELMVNNIIVDQKPSASPTGDKELTVNLTWTASSVPGTYTLTVRPYRGFTQGLAATLQINVTDSAVAPTLAATNPSGTGGFPTGVPTVDPTCRARVDINGLRMRSQPDTTRDNVITEFVVNETPVVLARLSNSSWYQVQDTTSPQIGWISAAYVTLTGNCNTIPVLAAPSTPTPTATIPSQPQPQPTDLVALSPSGLLQVQLGSNGTGTAVYTLLIRNDGGRDSGSFDVLIALPGGEQVTVNVPNLAPGAATTVPQNGLNITFGAPGTQRILYQVDFDNKVTETNEANNIAFLDVTVSAP